ncbi:MAG TPA: FAD-binding dehydrogenase [Candidatus Limnocylindria bacterium]|nr:FAD-binding dehydrogenase [Candidatus Limnocylindria bacterium]
MDADVIVVGAGLAGLVAAAEAADAGKRVIVLDQEPEASLGGQAFWSFGGLFMVDTPEQRRLGVKDSRERALRDWNTYAGFDRDADRWPRRWAEAYVDFAAGEMRPWLHAMGVRWFPLVQWAERAGNSVPRFHITWGTGPGVVAPFERRVREHAASGRVALRHRHRVTSLLSSSGAVEGVAGEVLAPSDVARGQKSSREVAVAFEMRAPAVIITSGGIGADHDLVRKWWPSRLGTPPAKMLSGVPDHVDGKMLDVARAAGANLINLDRMWNYPEGVENYAPIWTRHGIRILPGPTPLWLDALGRRLPAPVFPGFDALAALEQIARSGHDHSWFVMDSKVFGRELALSGSEQNPDLTGKSIRGVLQRALPSAVKPVEAFGKRGEDFLFAPTVAGLAAKMNHLAGADEIDAARLEREIAALDEQAASPTPADPQLAAIREARRYISDRLIRVVRPHRMLDPKAGPLVAVRLWILTRKTLGGIETDLEGRALREDGTPLPGLYAAGEVAGFGGGGVHGYRSLEGTFLGGSIFSGRVAGRAAARSS